MKRRLSCVSNSMFLPICVFYACIPVTLYLSYLCLLCLYPSICLYLSSLCFLCLYHSISFYLSYLCFLYLYPSILVSVLSVFSMLVSQYPCIRPIYVFYAWIPVSLYLHDYCFIHKLFTNFAAGNQARESI